MVANLLKFLKRVAFYKFKKCTRRRNFAPKRVKIMIELNKPKFSFTSSPSHNLFLFFLLPRTSQSKHLFKWFMVNLILDEHLSVEHIRSTIFPFICHNLNWIHISISKLEFGMLLTCIYSVTVSTLRVLEMMHKWWGHNFS